MRHGLVGGTLIKGGGSGMREVLRRSLERLIRLQLQDGSFLYKYSVDSGPSDTARYNLVRHAGCSYALATACTHAHASDIAKLPFAADRSILFLTNCLSRYGDRMFVKDPISSDGNLGATALFCLAIGSEQYRNAYPELLSQLVKSLVSISGASGYLQSRVPESQESPESGQDYYPGEVLLALVQSWDLMTSEEAISIFTSSFHYYRTRFNNKPNTGMILWHIETWAKVAELASQQPSMRPLVSLELRKRPVLAVALVGLSVCGRMR